MTKFSYKIRGQGYSPEKHELIDTHIKYVQMICKVSMLRMQGVQVEGVQGERARILSTSVSISI